MFSFRKPQKTVSNKVCVHKTSQVWISGLVSTRSKSHHQPNEQRNLLIVNCTIVKEFKLQTQKHAQKSWKQCFHMANYWSGNPWKPLLFPFCSSQNMLIKMAKIMDFVLIHNATSFSANQNPGTQFLSLQLNYSEAPEESQGVVRCLWEWVVPLKWIKMAVLPLEVDD